MRATALILSLLMVVALTCVFALAQDEKPAEKVDVAKVIDRLGSDDFAARKKAEKDLLALGDKAIPALKTSFVAAKALPASLQSCNGVVPSRFVDNVGLVGAASLAWEDRADR